MRFWIVTTIDRINDNYHYHTVAANRVQIEQDGSLTFHEFIPVPDYILVSGFSAGTWLRFEEKKRVNKDEAHNEQ